MSEVSSDPTVHLQKNFPLKLLPLFILKITSFNCYSPLYMIQFKKWIEIGKYKFGISWKV